MDLYTAILGPADGPEFATALHRLEHREAVDWVVLPRADLPRRRLRAVSERGQSVAIALPRDEKLYDGAVLRLDDEAALVVKVEAEDWLRVRPAGAEAALRIGYHAGNLHWRVRFDGTDLMVALEGPEDRYRARLADMVAEGVCTIVEEVPA
ncbi:MAG: urease accessory protein UreE [Pseudomonadota bacterium]